MLTQSRDNNPVTLPNVRLREVVFICASHFGGDIIVSGLGETLTWSGLLMKEAISQAVKTTVDMTVLDPVYSLPCRQTDRLAYPIAA